MKRFGVAIVVMGPSLWSASASAQAAAPVSVTVGSRVRIFAPTMRRDVYVGRIDTLQQGEVVLDTTGVRRRLGFEMGPVLVESFRRVKLRTSTVERVEISGGRTTRSTTIKGALIGGLVGALLVGLGQAPEVNPGFDDFMKGAPIGLAVGAVLGGGVGYALGGERWLPATLPPT